MITFPELSTENPFYYGEIVIFGDNDAGLYTREVSFPPSNQDRLYTTTDGDTLSNIAYEAYGSSKWWWVIQMANEIEFPFELEFQAGTTLRIPDLSNSTFELA